MIEENQLDILLINHLIKKLILSFFTKNLILK